MCMCMHICMNMWQCCLGLGPGVNNQQTRGMRWHALGDLVFAYYIRSHLLQLATVTVD